MNSHEKPNLKRPRSRSPSSPSRAPSRQAMASEISTSAIERPPKKRNDDQLSERERLDIERRKRMERLRAENEAEEQKMAVLDKAAKIRGEGGEYDPEELSSEKTGKDAIIEVNEEDLEGLDEDEQMQKLFGIGGFGSTKGKAVKDNQNSAAKGTAAKNKARKYRQYMNRKGGFNRPLQKMN
mmetsp:Transcript_17017/g.20777  ORF Transcript_17017/g.20777 Transcript_17017/m.20777 type:complete len:182 (-) Transcript_17017:143-688(-)